MRMYDIITKKKHSLKLTKEEIEFFIKGFTNGEIPDYQASALMMAVCLNGMDKEETAILTNAMALSGDTVDLSRFGTQSVDKHSTGGVGDKTTLVVAPIVAALGGKVAKMSGRGLGHTGGTVDKLESIKGYKTSLEIDEFLKQVEEIGIAVIGQTGNLAPADKKLYALRDVTATVDSIPLITSSIMSKKLAAGAHSIVLDVKVGSGAFMKTIEDAEKLAENMVAIGKLCGRNMAALITDMDTPLGNAIGNSLEVIEAISILKGQNKGDLYQVCVALCTQMVSLIHNVSLKEAKETVVECINSGAAFNKMKQWISAQGGDTNCLDHTSLFEKAKYSFNVVSTKEGYITKMDAEKIGTVSVMLGGGRITKEDTIDFSAGIILNKKTGDFVKMGDTLCTLYTNNEQTLENAKKVYLESLTIQDTPSTRPPLIYKTVI
jgi:pyrimidine-nucleoside phosphorylase